MLTLDKISTSSIFYSNKDEKIVNLLKKYNIRNFKDLKQQIESGNPDFNDDHLINLLKYTELQVRFYRKRNISAPTYNFTAYDNSSVVDIDKLYETDKLVTGKSLITTDLMHYNSNALLKLNNTKISLIKEYSKSVTITGKNMLYRLIEPNEPNNFDEIAKSISFYDEQVIRSYQDSKTGNQNIFENDSSIKKAIVDKHARPIVKHLLTNGDKFIFGNLSFIDKHQILHYLDCDSNDLNKERINKLLQIVADYTTLKELTSNDVLDTLEKRFILK